MDTDLHTFSFLLSLVVGLVLSAINIVRRRRRAERALIELSIPGSERREGIRGKLALEALKTFVPWLPLLVVVAVQVLEIADPIRKWTVAIVIGAIVTSIVTWRMLDAKNNRASR